MDAQPAPLATRDISRWVKPRLEESIEALDHLLVDATNVREAAPAGQIQILAYTLKLRNELLHQTGLITVFLPEVGLAQQRYVKSHRNLLRSPHSGPHPGPWLLLGLLDELDAPEAKSRPIIVNCDLANAIEPRLTQHLPAIVPIEIARIFLRRTFWVRKPQYGVTSSFRRELPRQAMEFGYLSHKGQGERECLHVFNWQGKLTPRDYAALTPLIWEHVNPYGRFDLDMNTRLALL